MTFVERFLHGLGDGPAITEVHGEQLVPTSGTQLRGRIARARGTLRAKGLTRGDRVGLVAPNSANWVAADIAMLAEGLIVVPLYARQDPSELRYMIEDAGCKAVVGVTELCDTSFDELFAGEAVDEAPVPLGDTDDVTIIYTSGTSGEPKGVVYQRQNVEYMLPCTASALSKMMGRSTPDHTVFHYLPFCFAGSRVVLWTCLLRGNELRVSTDLDNLAVELKAARPNYVLNVPALLDRIKLKVDQSLADKPAPIRWLVDAGLRAFGSERRRDKWVYGLAKRVVFDKVKAQVGPDLECLICGSAPLSVETQRWFMALGIPVYQVYGLTETTAIVTMDVPPNVAPGFVGPALDGVETRLKDGELQVRGPNIFSRYWNKPEATEAAFDDGWFRTGDQAEDDGGNWKIIGRVKNLLVPSSGHNVAPEPLEQKLREGIRGVEQAVVVGHGKPFLSAILTGEVDQAQLDEALQHINTDLPHYKRIRRVHLAGEAFTPESGLLTANRKLKRKAIEDAFAAQIEDLYG